MSIVKGDSSVSRNFISRNFSQQRTITTVSAGTVALSSFSTTTQIFEGSTLGQIINLGDATSYIDNGIWFVIVNKSTTNIDIRNNSGTSLLILEPGFSVLVTLQSNATSDGTWTIGIFVEDISAINGPKGRLPILYWEFSTNANNYLYYGGQTKSNETPFVSGSDGLFNEIAVAGRVNSVDSNALWTIYRVPASAVPVFGSITPAFGSLATVTNQGLTYYEADYPYVGSTRMTINLVNNGASLPLSFSENVNTRTLTIQLATNGGGTITTTATQLRDAFRSNKTIQQIWRITGTGGTLSAASFVCSGGSLGDEIAAIHLRANSSNYRANYAVVINPGDVLIGRCIIVDTGSISNMQMTGFISY